jgi:DNA-binding MarR family transcriptional regulator
MSGTGVESADRVDADGMPAPAGAPRWLDERENRAWRSFLSMQARLRYVLGKELHQQTGLSDADYAVLVHLSEAPGGRLRPFELGMAADWEKSRLSHHLTRMERRGLVTREHCPSDSRGAFVALTPVGRGAIEVAAPFHVEQVRRWFLSVMSPEQLEMLTLVSETVLSRLEAQGETQACGDAECGWTETADILESDDADENGVT